ncbi:MULTISPECIES: DNA repair protein RecO [unclassified Pseudodesulfovibrio]|uniref:DNA repair protein RecO n=1 Tax=unclassified Pseudodesulfovibrio TaxID=2661612 RepID=UPI000FEB846D|nr:MULTISPECIES: DNA repair protein RecO [unclassified Pseudodesulfovibrio]MCJ2163756.1 DNA repair protein RecO [Pseudodesulfovibrio sp. S3-i]RWU05994.1 DNA repair protein RecO [Pseudodesulfovibrio sp. S3]
MNGTEKCLVLKVGRFREADVWVKLLTPTRGVFNGFAFGGSRSRRRFVGCLDPLSHVLFTIGTNKTGTYTVLEEGSLLHNFPMVRKDPVRTGLAVNCIKFIEAVEIDPSDARPVYSLLLETLHMLESGGGSSDFTPWLFRAKLAFEMGYTPDFLTCGTCGLTIAGQDGYRFGVEKGQVACRTCLSGGKPLEGLARPISTGVLRALDWIQQSRPADWVTVAMDSEVRRQSSQLIELFVAYHLGLSWEGGMYKKV